MHAYGTWVVTRVRDGSTEDLTAWLTTSQVIRAQLRSGRVAGHHDLYIPRRIKP